MAFTRSPESFFAELGSFFADTDTLGAGGACVASTAVASVTLGRHLLNAEDRAAFSDNHTGFSRVHTNGMEGGVFDG